MTEENYTLLSSLIQNLSLLNLEMQVPPQCVYFNTY